MQAADGKLYECWELLEQMVGPGCLFFCCCFAQLVAPPGGMWISMNARFLLFSLLHFDGISMAHAPLAHFSFHIFFKGAFTGNEALPLRLVAPWVLYRSFLQVRRGVRQFGLAMCLATPPPKVRVHARSPKHPLSSRCLKSRF